MKKILIFAIALLSASPAFSATQQAATELLMHSMDTSLDTVSTTLQSVALKWLGAFMLLQFVWTNIAQIVSGAEIEKFFAKLAGSLLWGGVCIYLFENGAPFITKVSGQFLEIGSGIGTVAFDPTSPLDKGIGVASSLLEQLDKTQGIFQSLNPFPSIMMGLVSVVILGTSALIAFKILMLFIETKIVIALSPISFALLGLDALREQGFAPLKYLIALAYRVMIYAAILITISAFSAEIIKEFATLPAMSDPSVWPPIWAAALGYVLLFGVAWKADSIATMLASGSSQMSTGDAAAVGAVAGAAAAAAVSGGASLASGAKSTGKSAGPMSEFLKKMGQGVEISAPNKSGDGNGGDPDFSTAPKRSDFESPASRAPDFSTPPKRSDYESPAKQSTSSNAGIGGTENSNTDKQGHGRQPSFGSHLKDINEHAQRESSAVHVSMNTHSEL